MRQAPHSPATSSGPVSRSEPELQIGEIQFEIFGDFGDPVGKEGQVLLWSFCLGVARKAG